jgi:hypothetical protein
MTVKITHRVLEDKEYLNSLVDLTESNDFPWYYIHTSAHYDDYDNGWQFSFYHMLVENGEFNRSTFTPDFEKLIYTCVDKAGFSNMKINRVRLGLFTRTESKKVQTPHVDWDKPHKTIVYYLNQSDGDTYFYREKYDRAFHQGEDTNPYHKYYVSDVSPYNQNSMVSFEGHTYHSSSSPLNHNVRIAMNINVI